MQHAAAARATVSLTLIIVSLHLRAGIDAGSDARLVAVAARSLANVLIGLLIARSLVEQCAHVSRYRRGTPMSDYRGSQSKSASGASQRAELTQAELARLCGVTRQTIIALEAEKYSPSLELAFKLARALGRNLDEVFQYAEKKYRHGNRFTVRLA